jgi:hypothetical protein
LREYVTKNNGLMLADTISFSNKIERGLYEESLMEDCCELFEHIDMSKKMEASLKAVSIFVENSVLFYKSKSKPNLYDKIKNKRIPANHTHNSSMSNCEEIKLKKLKEQNKSLRHDNTNKRSFNKYRDSFCYEKSNEKSTIFMRPEKSIDCNQNNLNKSV